MGGQPIWLSFSQEEALENAREKEGIPVVLEVNLPEDWLLNRAETGTYLSWRDIPAEHIKPFGSPELSGLKKGDIVPGSTYRGRYNLISFKYGIETGNVCEQSERFEDIIDVAVDIFSLNNEELAQLAEGQKVIVEHND